MLTWTRFGFFDRSTIGMDPHVEFPRGMIRIMKRGNVVEDAGTIPDVPMRPPGPPLDPSRVTRAELEQVPRGVLRINAASFAPNANLELPRTSNIRYSRPRSPPRFRAPANSHLAPRGRTLAPVGVPPLRYRPIEQPRSIRLATNVSRPVQPVITRPSKSAVGSDIKSAPVFASGKTWAAQHFKVSLVKFLRIWDPVMRMIGQDEEKISDEIPVSHTFYATLWWIDFTGRGQNLGFNILQKCRVVLFLVTSQQVPTAKARICV